MSLRAACGWAALVLLGAMSGLLWAWIRPATGMLPQASPGLSEAQLASFGLALARAGLTDLYRTVLGYGDTAYIGCFALWVALSLRGWLGTGLALFYALLDLGENRLLLSSFYLRADDLTGFTVYLPAETGKWAFVGCVTTLKLAMAVGLIIAIVARELRERRTQ